MFATYRLQEIMVSDNGTVFTSMEYSEFSKISNSTHHRGVARLWKVVRPKPEPPI